MGGQLAALPEWFDYFAGAADKIQGETIPTDEAELLRLHAPRAGRRRRRDHAVELAAAAADLEARAGARRGLHVRGQARRADARRRRSSSPRLLREGRLPARRLQRRHRLRGRAPASALGGAPGRRQGRVHRLDGDRHARDAGARPSTSRASASSSAASRRRSSSTTPTSRPRANGVIAGHLRGDRTDLHRRLAAVRPRGGPRRAASSALSRRARRRSGSAIRSTTATEMGPVAIPEQLDKVKQLHRDRPGRRAPTLATGGQPPTAPELRRRLLHRADRLHRRRQRDANRTARRSSGRCSRRFASRPRRSWSARPTTLATGSPRASGRRTSSARTASRTRCGPARCGSTATASVSPSAPFGGCKMSGIGRENGLETIKEYTETKTVWVELSGADPRPVQPRVAPAHSSARASSSAT